MALSNAEKQRRYRQKRDQDPARRQEYLRKSKEKYETDKAVGKVATSKNIKSERQRRLVRKQWRIKSRQYRLKQKQKQLNIQDEIKHNMENDSYQRRSNDEVSEPSTVSHQLKSARKRQQKKRNEINRKMMLLQNSLKQAKKKAEMYRKRWVRAKSNSNTKGDNDKTSTPRTKTKKLLHLFSKEGSKKTVKKCLLFHNVLVAALRKEYKDGKHKTKETLSSIVAGDIVKKYQMSVLTRQELGAASSHGIRRKTFTLTHRLDRKLTEFFERDDISRQTSGIKETVTRFKVKKQKRILRNNMKRLHKQFLAENKGISISYASFSRKRPFWVVPPTAKDRDTCACKIHENMKFMVQSLYCKKVLKSSDPKDLVERSVCDTKNEQCMYGDCTECKDTTIETEYNPKEQITWWKWTSKKESRQVKNESKNIVVTVKEKQNGTIGELVDQYKEAFVVFKKHTYILENQHSHYSNIRKNIKENEVVIHVDFAENYTSQLSTEVQSMHFGGSKNQITLHTGVYTVKGNNAVSFCTVSDSLQHGPAGIWAFLSPVLDDIRLKHHAVDTIHFFSDGPVTQYRQKNNFFLFSTELAQKGFTSSTWNFHESGHGKGAPDGVGAALKRAANNAVLCGGDITNAGEFVKAVQETTSVLLYEVKPEAVQQMVKKIPKSIPAVPGTMKLHQIVSSTAGSIFYRDVSCNCFEGHFHPGHELKPFAFKTYKTYTKPKGNAVTGEHQDCPNETVVENESDAYFTMEQPHNSEVNTQEQQTEPCDTCANVECDYKNETMEDNDNKTEFYHSNTALNDDRERQTFYLECLQSLQRCKTFSALKDKCSEINRMQSRYRLAPKPISIESSGLAIDANSLRLFPDDIETDDIIFPVSVQADGDCLPHSGSVIAFGHENNAVEIRVRIIIEQTLFQEVYLSDSFLQKGLDETDQIQLSKTFAMFSEEYIPGVCLDNTTIKTVYENEVLKITEAKTYMGIWQVFALSSVLGSPLMSIYPQLGNPNVRNVLCRTVQPRERNEAIPAKVSIMWTTTRGDMTIGHWVPNHFVPVIPTSTDNTHPVHDHEHLPTEVQDLYTDLHETEFDLSETVEESNGITVAEITLDNGDVTASNTTEKCLMETMTGSETDVNNNYSYSDNNVSMEVPITSYNDEIRRLKHQINIKRNIERNKVAFAATNIDTATAAYETVPMEIESELQILQKQVLRKRQKTR